MGWRYRKSVKLPLGFRLNFSKSGMGWSWGVKGARITKMANGKTRYTATYPGGLQYIEERGPKQRKPVRKSTGSWNTPGQNGPEPPKKRSGCLKWGLIVLSGMIVITAIGQALGIIEPEEDTSSSTPESSMVSEISSAPESSALSEPSELSKPEEPPTPVEPSSESAPESSAPAVITPSEPADEPSEAPAEEPAESSEEPQAVLSFTSVPTSASRNSDVTVSIHGLPNTDYYISVRYSSGPATADGLGTKTSDADGNVSWTWHIGGRTSLDYDPIITVSGGGEEITARFTVTE